MKPLGLRRNFTWTLAGNLVLAGTQWAMVVVLAKLGTPADVGTYAYALAVTGPIILLSNLKLRAAQATDAAGDFRFGHYLAVRLVTTALASVVIAAIALAGGYGATTALAILLVGASKCAESVSDGFYGLFQQQERMDLISTSMVLRGAGGLLLVTAIQAVTGRVAPSLAGLALGWTAVLIGYDIPSARRLRRAMVADPDGRLDVAPRWEWHRLWALAVLTAPLGASVALGSLYTNIPRYFLERHQGTAELGIFSAITYVMVASGTVINALGQSASPRLARYHAAGDVRAFARLVGRLVLIGVALGVAGILVAALAGEWVLRLLYTAEYAAQQRTFVFVMVAAAVQYAYIFLGSAVSAMRLFRLQFWVTAASTALLAAACVALVPAHGMMGAAWAMIASRALEAVAYGVIVRGLARRGPRVAEREG